MISIFGHDFQGLFSKIQFAGPVAWYEYNGQLHGRDLETFSRYCESSDSIKIALELIIWKGSDVAGPQEIKEQYQWIKELSEHSNLVFVVETELHQWCMLDKPFYQLDNVYWLLPGTVKNREQFVISWQAHIYKIAQLYSHTELQAELKNLPVLEPKPLAFDALLGRPKPHRRFVHDKIVQSNLEKNSITTIIEPNKSYAQDKPISTNPNFVWEPGCVPVAGQPHWHLFHSVTYHGVETSFYSIIPVSVYRQTAYSVLSETTWQNEILMVTEKVAKVALGQRIFVAFGGQGFLAYLRSIGFETFGSVLDESYDDIADNQERWQAAWNQLIWLSSQDQAYILKKLQPVLEHNYNHAMNREGFLSDTVNHVQRLIDFVQHGS